ncbi:MAG: hypothetical protein HZC28_16120 [Spirochaetes bacterium]|nr:hypothetical protein [Spirochaetota bacterium]
MLAHEEMITDGMRTAAKQLVLETRNNKGLAPVDIERFWRENDKACATPFGDIPHMALGIRMSWECVFDELGIPEDPWRYLNDEAWALSLNKQYNDKAEAIIGKRLLTEKPTDRTLAYPAVKQLHDVFEAKNIWHAGSWWLEQSAHSEAELSALLDRVEERNRNLRAFLLPDNWESEKKRLMALGRKPPLYRFQRGPVTFAMSVYGVEPLIYLILDNPTLAGRFRDVMITTMLSIGRILDEEAGYTPETAPHGFQFNDDNCAMLNPDMYEFFGYPVLKAMFSRYSPLPKDRRYQHSDSAMAHLLPLLGTLNFTGVNFGPTLSVNEIRAHMPNANIDGQLAPFTFSRNEEENIVLETLRDFEQSKAHRGVMYTTAGSINNGSRLTGMRLIMSTLQNHCRY